jgi:hypothetical protein
MVDREHVISAPVRQRGEQLVADSAGTAQIDFEASQAAAARADAIDASMGVTEGRSALVDNEGNALTAVIPQTTGEQRTTTSQRPERRRAGRTLAAAAAVVGLLAAGAALSGLGGDKDDQTPTASAGELAKADEACADSWAVMQANNENSRVIGKGVPTIERATNDAEARQGLSDWFNIIKHDPEALAGNANVFNELMGNKTNYVGSDLHDGECFNAKGEQVAIELETLLASSSVSAGEAPASAFNSGVDAEGNLVTASAPGIDGNRKAANVTLPNDSKASVLARCGNVAVPNKPGLPEGPTDQPTTTSSSTPETTPSTKVNPKHDDGKLPGDPSVPADQDKGTPDVAGDGPAGQKPDNDGYLPQEPRPTVPETTPTTHPQTTPTTNRPTATTSPSPTSTNPPVTATTSTPTTAPQDKPLPPKP